MIAPKRGVAASGCHPSDTLDIIVFAVALAATRGTSTAAVADLVAALAFADGHQRWSWCRESATCSEQDDNGREIQRFTGHGVTPLLGSQLQLQPLWVLVHLPAQEQLEDPSSELHLSRESTVIGIANAEVTPSRITEIAARFMAERFITSSLKFPRAALPTGSCSFRPGWPKQGPAMPHETSARAWRTTTGA